MDCLTPYYKPDDPHLARLIELSKADIPLIILQGDPNECQKLAMDLAYYTDRTIGITYGGDNDAIIDIYGFEATDGTYVPSCFVKAAESGGIYYVHCIDLCNPAMTAHLKNAIDQRRYRKGMKLTRRNPPVLPRTRPPNMACEENFHVELDEGHDINSGFRCVASVKDLGNLDPGILDRAVVLEVTNL